MLATTKMSQSLKEVVILDVKRHKKDFSENAQLFAAAISSLRILMSSDEVGTPLLEC